MGWNTGQKSHAGEIGSKPIDLVKRWMQANERVDAYIRVRDETLRLKL